jgi:hypothetical protein
MRCADQLGYGFNCGDLFDVSKIKCEKNELNLYLINTRKFPRQLKSDIRYGFTALYATEIESNVKSIRALKCHKKAN